MQKEGVTRRVALERAGRIIRHGGNMNHKEEEAVSPVIGVILMVAISVVLAAVVFVLVSDIDAAEPAPTMAFRDDGDSYVLIHATPGLDWSEFTVTGCETVPEGPVVAGDMLEACTDPVRVTHIESNNLIWSS